MSISRHSVLFETHCSSNIKTHLLIPHPVPGKSIEITQSRSGHVLSNSRKCIQQAIPVLRLGYQLNPSVQLAIARSYRHEGIITSSTLPGNPPETLSFYGYSRISFPPSRRSALVGIVSAATG